jgi:hypothetical protein
MKMTVFWVVAPCSLVEINRRFRDAMMMVAVSISETSVNFYETIRRNIPEDSHLQKEHRLRVFNNRVLKIIIEPT